MTEHGFQIRRYLIRSLVGFAVVIFASFLLRPLEQSRQSARYVQCRNNLKLIGLALHTYHDEWGSFPPAYVADDEGSPIYGWRTLLLPYLDQAPLFNEYRFDEAWDGPQNSELRKRFPGGAMPFACPENPEYRVETSYLAVVGPNTAWPGLQPAKREKDFPDGLARTILVVEVEDTGIHWLEPRDLLFDEMSFKVNGPAWKSMSSRHSMKGNWPWSGTIAVVNVLFADGSVVRLSGDTAPETIRAWLTASGGEEVSLPP
jgi:prepilin-type processing-associated H-X9-DG protein